MSTAVIEFPLSPLRHKKEIVVEPIIPIGVLIRNQFRLFDFLVDSGADFTLLPRSLAAEIGLNLKQSQISTTLGVEGRGIKIYHAHITIQIGKWQDTIRCAFAAHDHIPPLLGRMDIFSRYNITFHGARRSIIFQRLQKK